MRLAPWLCASAALAALSGCAAIEDTLGGGDSELGPPPRRDRPVSFERRILDAYDAGLASLRRARNRGAWDGPDGRPSLELTALAVTAFHARPGGLRGADRDLAERGLEFVLSRVADDGSIHGVEAPTYAHAVVLACLAASGRADARRAASRCEMRLRTFQSEAPRSSLEFGGIGYGPGTAGRESDGDGSRSGAGMGLSRADLSNTVWALEGFAAAGAPPTARVFRDALVFLERCQEFDDLRDVIRTDPAETLPRRDGGASYRPGAGRGPTGSMTCALLRGYALCGVAPSSDRVRAALRWLGRNFALDHHPGMPRENERAGLFAYYAALARALRDAEKDRLDTPDGPAEWRADLVARLRALQRPDGSWSNDDRSWMEGEPLVATTYALSALADCAVTSGP